MADAELIPSALKIDKVTTRIEQGDIKIPAFQRGFVWNQGQVIDLLDSIYHNYPIGSILLWSSNERLKASRNVGGFQIPDRTPEYPVNYVLDGQQRLSTIYAVFCSDRTPAESALQYSTDLSIFDIAFDFDEEEFYPTSEVDHSHAYICLQSLFNTVQFFKAIEGLPDKRQEDAMNLHSRFNNYELPVVTISGRSKDEVGIIFERINSLGTTLTTLDLMVAWTWSEDFHLQERINELLEILDQKGFGDLPERIILQSISGILHSSTKSRTILGLNPDDVRSNFSKMEDSLILAVDFLSTELHVTSLELLPHVQQIVPLTCFFSMKGSPTAKQLKTVKEWFWKTSFSRRYSGGTDEKMDQDIDFLKAVAQETVASAERYSYTVESATLKKQRMSKGNPYARAYLLLLAQKSPLDLVNGQRIDLGEALSKYNRKEYHHVFPQAFLKRQGYETEEVNSLCNFCFLPSGSNKKISSRAPADYIQNMLPSDGIKQILESNLLPLRIEVYTSNDYDKFLDLRSERVLEFLDSLLI